MQDRRLQEQALGVAVGSRPVFWMGRPSSENTGGLPPVTAVSGRARTTARTLGSAHRTVF